MKLIANDGDEFLYSSPLLAVEMPQWFQLPIENERPFEEWSSMDRLDISAIIHCNQEQHIIQSTASSLL